MSNLNFSDIIEALLFASEKPVPFKKLAQIPELAPDSLQIELDELREEKARIGSRCTRGSADSSTCGARGS